MGSYRVDVSQEDTGSVSTNSNSSIVDVGGLDICRFKYSFLASVLTPGGVQGNLSLSSPVSFTVDLSGKRSLLLCMIIITHPCSIERCLFVSESSKSTTGMDTDGQLSLSHLHHWLHYFYIVVISTPLLTRL